MVVDLKIMWLARVNSYSPSYSRYIRVSFICQFLIITTIIIKCYLYKTGTKITFKKFPVSSLGIPSVPQIKLIIKCSMYFSILFSHFQIYIIDDKLFPAILLIYFISYNCICFLNIFFRNLNLNCSVSSPL